MNETWIGVGVARDHFVEFMKPYETECVEAAHDAGYLVSFHNCGRATLLLEDMADTGPDAIETLTSNRSSGDVDLADAKQRIGDRVCLFGGFNEHLLHEADADAVREEVRRCLDAAMDGRRLRAALDRPALRREAGPDRGRVRDRARARALHEDALPCRGRICPAPTRAFETSAGRIVSGPDLIRRRADVTDDDLYDVETAADGPSGALPLTPEFLRDSPSGDVFGLTQNAGMGWEAVEGRPRPVPHPLDPGRRAGRRRHAGRARLPHRPLGGRAARTGGGAGARPPGRAAVRRARLRPVRRPHAGHDRDVRLAPLPQRRGARPPAARPLAAAPARRHRRRHLRQGPAGDADGGRVVPRSSRAPSSPAASRCRRRAARTRAPCRPSGRVSPTGSSRSRTQPTSAAAPARRPGGGCQFLGTAATSQVVAEALGLTVPHAALAPSGQPIWLDVARRTAQAVHGQWQRRAHARRRAHGRGDRERDARPRSLRRLDEPAHPHPRDRPCRRPARGRPSTTGAGSTAPCRGSSTRSRTARGTTRRCASSSPAAFRR